MLGFMAFSGEKARAPGSVRLLLLLFLSSKANTRLQRCQFSVVVGRGSICSFIVSAAQAGMTGRSMSQNAKLRHCLPAHLAEPQGPESAIFVRVKIAPATKLPYFITRLFSASYGSLAAHPYFSLFFYRLTPEMAVWQGSFTQVNIQ
ncbi:MAG: hypothetical protein ACREP9_22390 [Candidatus Dormibacteraceae bacterium]